MSDPTVVVPLSRLPAKLCTCPDCESDEGPWPDPPHPSTPVVRYELADAYLVRRLRELAEDVDAMNCLGGPVAGPGSIGRLIRYLEQR